MKRFLKALLFGYVFIWIGEIIFGKKD